MQLERMLKKILEEIRGGPDITENKKIKQTNLPVASCNALEEFESYLEDENVLNQHILFIYNTLLKNNDFNRGSVNMRTNSVMKTCFEFETIRKYSWTGGCGPKRKKN